jgi:hypothetical protein
MHWVMESFKLSFQGCVKYIESFEINYQSSQNTH